MAEFRHQSGLETNPDNSARAGAESTVNVALGRQRMKESTISQFRIGTTSADTACSGDTDTDCLVSHEDNSSKQKLDIWRQDTKIVDDCKEKKKRKSVFQKIHKLLPLVDFTMVTVNSLPQLFQVKYLGKRSAGAPHDAKHTRRLVEDMLKCASKLPSGSELPLVVLHVTRKGIYVREHEGNKNKEFESGLIPIEFISFGMQDLKCFRVFAIIMMHGRSPHQDGECRAWSCDSPASARRLALSVSLAFQELSN